MTNRFTIYRQLINAIHEAKNTQNLNSVIEQSGLVIDIYKAHKADVDELCKQQKFEDINGVNFNHWAWDTLETIERAINRIEGFYYDLHWQQKGFNAY